MRILDHDDHDDHDEEEASTHDDHDHDDHDDHEEEEVKVSSEPEGESGSAVAGPSLGIAAFITGLALF